MKTFILSMFMLITMSIQAQDSTQVQSFEEITKPYVEKLLEGIEQGVEFGIQEIPLVLKEYLVFESIKYGIIILAGVLLIPIGFYYNKKWYDKWETPKTLGGPLVICLGIIIISANLLYFIKVTFFPKLYIVEKFIDLI